MSIEILPEVQAETQREESEEMATGLHGFISGRLNYYLSSYVEPKGLGYVFGDGTEFDIPGLGTRIKKPDAAFVSLDKMTEPIDDVIPFAPDLAVEVFSRTDGWKDMLDKAMLYLEKGTKLVWVIDPYSKKIFVFTPEKGLDFETLKVTVNDELTGGDLLPDFKLALTKLFEFPKRTAVN